MDVLEVLRTEFAKDDEVDYARLADQLGSSAVRALEELVGAEDPRIASQAVYLAGLIDGSGSFEVVAAGAASRHAIVRVSAAFALPRLPAGPASKLAIRLLSDPDAGVRGRAVRFAAPSRDPLLVRKAQEIAERDEEQWLRELAARLLDTNGGPPG